MKEARTFAARSSTLSSHRRSRSYASHLDLVAAASFVQVGMYRSKGSAVLPLSQDIREAVDALLERIAVLQAFLRKTAEGKIKPNHSLLRKISAICFRDKK